MDQDPSGKFEAIFHQHYKHLCGIAYNLTGDLDASKDIVQEVFFKLWGRREKMVLDAPIIGYLRQATTHACYNFLEQNKSRSRILSEVDWLSRPAPAESAQTLNFSELESAARKAIDRLPPKCKAIFLLSRQEEMKYQEIADHLGLSIKTVEHQMGIALEKLRDDLKPFLTKEFLIPLCVFLVLLLISKIIQLQL